VFNIDDSAVINDNTKMIQHHNVSLYISSES